MRLPAYPLATCDPYFSIWSRTDLLTGSDTVLWCGIEKPIRGTAQIDGKDYRFLGLGDAPVMEQLSVDVQPYVTSYVFRQHGVELTVRFWTPLLLDDLFQLSLPVSFIDFTMDCDNPADHAVTVTISPGCRTVSPIRLLRFGLSWISSPTPWPSPWLNRPAYPAPSMISRAILSMSAFFAPSVTASMAATCALRTVL